MGVKIHPEKSIIIGLLVLSLFVVGIKTQNVNATELPTEAGIDSTTEITTEAEQVAEGSVSPGNDKISSTKKKTKKKAKKKQYGWVKDGKKYYYYDRSSGKQKKNKKVDGIKLNKDGSAKYTKYNYRKIKTMIEARKLVNKLTKKSDSKQTKLKKVFTYMKMVRYNKHHDFSKLKKKSDWEIIYANDIFYKGDGCCIAQSSALAFMAHECGYKTVYLCHDGDHAWVEINGRVYDALLARIKNHNSYYNATYRAANLGAVEKKKI